MKDDWKNKAPTLTCLKSVKENHKKTLATSPFCSDNGGCRVSLRSSCECRGRIRQCRCKGRTKKPTAKEQSACSLIHEACLGARAKFKVGTSNLARIPPFVKHKSSSDRILVSKNPRMRCPCASKQGCAYGTCMPVHWELTGHETTKNYGWDV